MADYLVVDVFAEEPGGGNPAGVVLDAEGLDEASMQRIATRVGLSDTAFLTRRDGRPFLRWFTPAAEVPFCGHATIATAHALGAEREPVELDYAGGTVTVRPEVLGGEVVYWLIRPAPKLQPAGDELGPLLAALGSRRLDDELPAARSTNDDLIVPFADPAAVEELQPDMAALGDACRALGVFGVTALASPGPPGYEVRTRFFAPHLGVPEDPATGSAHAAVAVYLYEAGLVACFPEELRAHSLQGARDGRRGVIWLKLHIEGETPTVAEVGGRAVTVGRGEVA